MNAKELLKFICLSFFAGYAWFCCAMITILAHGGAARWITFLVFLLLVSMTCSWSTAKKPFANVWLNRIFPFLTLAVCWALLGLAPRLMIIPENLPPLF